MVDRMLDEKVVQVLKDGKIKGKAKVICVLYITIHHSIVFVLLYVCLIQAIVEL